MNTKYTDEAINLFAEAAGCSDIVIERKPDTRNKKIIYIKFKCSCGRPGGKKWHRFQKDPKCNLCMKAEKPKISDEAIKKKVEENGCEFVKLRRELIGKRRRIKVTYICSCDKDTSRVEHEMVWEVINSGAKCMNCIKARREETTLERHGVKNKFEDKESIKQSIISKYGVDHVTKIPGVAEKIRAIILERYGSETPFGSSQIQEKIRATHLERYGVEYAMQNTELYSRQKRSAFAEKEVIGPKGKVFKCQGYEPWALEILFETFEEDDILSESEISSDIDIPEFWYIRDGRHHRYYPDLYIVSLNKIIEVKSVYTAFIDPEMLELKMGCVFDAGFEMELWIFDGKKNLVIQ